MQGSSLAHEICHICHNDGHYYCGHWAIFWWGHEQLTMDYYRKAHCLVPHGRLDGLCTQEHYAHEPLPFQWPSRASVQQVLTLEQTYVSHSRWWHGTASWSFAPPQFPSSIGTPWQSAWCRDWDQLLSPIRLVWSLPDKRHWNAKMKLIVRSFSQKHSIPGLPSYGLPPCLQECPSSCLLRHLLPQVWGPTASPQVSGLPRRLHSLAAWRLFPCGHLVSCSLVHLQILSPLGPTAWFLQLDGAFRTTKGNWMRAISVTIEDSNLLFGIHWGMLRQCPLVIAYRGRTDRGLNYRSNYVLSWKDQVIAYG